MAEDDLAAGPGVSEVGLPIPQLPQIPSGGWPSLREDDEIEDEDSEEGMDDTPVAVPIEKPKFELPPKETQEKFKTKSNEDLTRFQSKRDEIDDRNEVADYMYKAAQNRTLESEEREKGLDRSDDTRANTGSVLFHRQVNQLASQLSTVMYRGQLFKYVPRTTETVIGSGEDSIDLSAQANGIAKWNLERINFQKKIPEFATSLFKYSDVFIGCSWVEHLRRKMAKKPTIQMREQNGEMVPYVIGDTIEISKAREAFCDFFILHADQVWVDRTIADIQGQNCVIIGRLRNRSEIYGDVLAGFFDKDQYKEIKDVHKYDGTYMDRSQKVENQNLTAYYDAEDVFIQWDIFRRSPIDEDKKKWDPETPTTLWWGTVIGNDISSGVLVRLERNPDPDDEIPIQDVHVYPDDSGDIYHTSVADIVRSLYSTDCTLMNMVLDNGAMLNDPPLLVNDALHHIRDFSFRRSAKWPVDDVERAVKEFRITPTTMNTVQLREMVTNDAMTALATDKPMMGMAHGSRTSASEANAITQNSIQPHMVQIRYILYQLLPWMGRKMMSYWQIYGDPNTVLKITEINKVYEVSPKNLFGEFDVVIEIVDDYIDDTVRQGRIMQFLQILSGSPWLQQSSRHRVDQAELLYQAFEDFRFVPNRIIQKTGSKDAEKVASMENYVMIYGGKYDAPQMGEDHEIHLRVHRIMRARWDGIETQPEAKFVPLLDQHILMHEQIQGQEQQAAQQKQISQNSTPGQFVGNETAGQQGAAVQGAVNEVMV
jgi:hypothetical protein